MLLVVSLPIWSVCWVKDIESAFAENADTSTNMGRISKNFGFIVLRQWGNTTGNYL